MSQSFHIEYPVQLYPQPTSMSCWAAAASMVLGNQTAGPGLARLSHVGGLMPDYRNLETFAQGHGFEIHFQQSWTVEGIRELLQTYGPLLMGGRMPNSHMIVIGGMGGDGTPGGTTLQVYDPWPVGRGRILDVVYDDLMVQFPLATTAIMHRMVSVAPGR